MQQAGRSVPGIAVVPKLVADIVSQPALWCSYLVVALWWTMSFGALLVFQQSMQRCRVRTAQVMRVCAYAFFAILPLVPLFLAVLVCASSLVARGAFLHPIVFACGVPLPVVGVILFIWAGYKRYLRMPHGLAIAIASQVIAVLAVLIIVLQITLLLG